MRRADFYKLMDLIKEVKKIDAMILLHRNTDDSNFMSDQYEAKKTQLISDVIDELISPDIQSLQSFSLIAQIINKFYPGIGNGTILYDPEIQELSASI